MRNLIFRLKFKKGQAALEYLLMLGLLTVIALTAFHTMVPTAVRLTNGHYLQAAGDIVNGVSSTGAGVGGPFP